MGEINFHIENVEVPGHDPEFLRLWINHIVAESNKSISEITYIFCSDDYILNINRQYLNHNYYTDIITFNYNEGDVIGGDIFISVDTVKENAVEFGNGDFKNELQRVMIHGILHLCGFNDKTEAEQKVMTNKEDWALGELQRFT